MGDAGDIDIGWETVKGLVAKFIMAGTGFAGVVVFTRTVGKGDFGGVYLLLSLVMIAIDPIRGFGQAVRKRWSETDAREREILGAALLASGGATLIVAIVVRLARGPLADYTGLPGSWLLFVALFASLGVFVPFQQAIGAMGHPSKQTWNDALRSLVTLPAQVGLILAGLGALGIGYGLALATAIAGGVGAIIVRRRPALPGREAVRSLYEYGRYSSLNALIGKAYGSLDVLLLGFLLGTTPVANYETALRLTIPATFVPAVVSTALMPKVSNVIDRGGQFAEDVTNSLAYASILAVPIFFGSLALPRQLTVTAFGPEYAEAGPYLVGLALYQVVSSQVSIHFQTLSGMDLPEVGLRFNGVTLAFNVGVGVALAVTYGPLGVVVATVLAETLRCGLMARAVASRVDGVRVLPRPLWMQIVAGIVMYAAVSIAADAVVIASWFDLGIVVGIGAAVYGAVLIVVSPQTRLTVRSVYRDAVT
ncbi:polysaccharide biosynthesis protein [Halobacteriales archaeon SW_7_68_16]|nr:MAG: polysaccharide biosynthesis protein [Halobacteriales archaeon SW_7_68_16]